MTDDLFCPFCGSEDVEIQNKFTGNYKHGKPTYIAFNRCSLCGSSSRAYAYTIGIDNEFEDAVVHASEAWNRRSQVPLSCNNAEHWSVSWNDKRITFTCSFCQSKLNFTGKIHSFLPINRCPECLREMIDDLIEFKEEEE